MINMSMLDDSDLEVSVDSLGSNYKKREALEGGLYNLKVKAAYFVASKTSGAEGVKMEFEIVEAASAEEPRTYVETFWVVNGDKHNYVVINNKKVPISGFTKFKEVSLLTVGKSPKDLTTATKQIQVHDFESNSDVPQEVTALPEFEGRAVKAVISKTRTNKSIRDANNKWVDTNEEVFENSIEKFFSLSDETLNEKLAGSPAEFIAKCLEKFDKKIIDRFNKNGIDPNKAKKTSAPSASAAGTSADSWD